MRLTLQMLPIAWRPKTNYKAGQWVITPGGALAEGLADHTSGDTFDATNWDVSSAQGVGPPGPQGPQGPQGNSGAQGSTGAQGAPGPQGNAGVAGSAGPQGPQGPRGIDGATGSIGPQGPQGADSTVPGPQGATGPQGADGAASTVPGPQGAVGPQGAPGPQGAVGAASTVPGPQGAAGPAGADGGQVEIGYAENATATAQVVNSAIAAVTGLTFALAQQTRPVWFMATMFLDPTTAPAAGSSAYVSANITNSAGVVVGFGAVDFEGGSGTNGFATLIVWGRIDPNTPGETYHVDIAKGGSTNFAVQILNGALDPAHRSRLVAWRT